MRGGRAAWSVVRWSSRFFAAVNRAFPVVASGGGGWSSEVSAFVSATSPAALSATTRVSTLGVIPSEGRVRRVIKVKKIFHAHPRASANPINRPNINSCESSTPMSPSGTSASLARVTVVAGAVADVPCQAPGLPWSTIAVRVCAPLDPRLRECKRALRAKIGSKPGTLRSPVLKQ